jgi:hypothetical protein
VEGEEKRGRQGRLTAASLGQFLYGVFVGVDVAGMDPILLLLENDVVQSGNEYEGVKQVGV